MPRGLFAHLAPALALAAAATAAPLTWGTGGTGGSGTWNTNNSANWWNGSSTIVWPATSSGDDDAIFPATAGTVTLSGGVTVNDIAFTADGYLVEGGLLTLDGPAPAISTSTGVSAEISSAIACATGFQKTGDGTLILSGTYTYTADTTVAAGTLDLAATSSLKFIVTKSGENGGANIVTGPGTAVFRGAFEIDTSAVVTDTGMFQTLANVENQSFDSTFRVTGFTPDPGGVLWTKPQGSRTWTFDESTGELNLDVPNTPFQDWAQSNIAAIDTADEDPLADPDGDGTVNLSEFALNGDPLDGSDIGRLAGQTASVPALGNALIITFATRAGATFVGNSTTLDGLAYTVLGSTDLAGFGSPVTEVSPAIVPAGWPAPAAGYEYHTFRLNASTGLIAKGFLRVKVATAPVP